MVNVHSRCNSGLDSPALLLSEQIPAIFQFPHFLQRETHHLSPSACPRRLSISNLVRWLFTYIAHELLPEKGTSHHQG